MFEHFQEMFFMLINMKMLQVVQEKKFGNISLVKWITFDGRGRVNDWKEFEIVRL